jgi:predicted DNA-binding transcriptional regulator YafY
MATNKNAIIRYQTLDKCFRNPGRRFYIEDLIEACNNALFDYSDYSNGIKRRQVLEDIKFMESEHGWNVPLLRVRDGHRVYFRYEDLNFSINNQPLNQAEEQQLKEAILTLSRFKGMPQFEWIDELTARLDSGLDLSHHQEKIIDFEQNRYLKGLEFISPLYNAATYKKAIEVNYQSFKQDQPHVIVLHPYFLKQFNNRWYIFGQNDTDKYIINLALDRIISITDSSIQFVKNVEIDFSEYFEDFVGVSLGNDGQLEHVALEVANQLLPYIETKPLHGSQKIKNRGEFFTLVTLDIIPNYEFESLILSFGEGICILEPMSLREKLKNRIHSLNNKYI